jgi:hypothetical protein
VRRILRNPNKNLHLNSKIEARLWKRRACATDLCGMCQSLAPVQQDEVTVAAESLARLPKHRACAETHLPSNGFQEIQTKTYV